MDRIRRRSEISSTRRDRRDRREFRIAAIAAITFGASIAAPTGPLLAGEGSGTTKRPASVRVSREEPPIAPVERSARIAPVEHVKDGEELLVGVAAGSIELRGDPKATEFRIEAHFEVDGDDAKDVARRAQLVKLYAERAPDGAVVVDALFPGKPLPRDRARVVIVAPPLARASLRGSSGPIDVRGTSGHLRLVTKAGAIGVREHAGDLDATSDSGRISVDAAMGGVRATSASGAIEIRLADDNDHPMRLESKSGATLLEVGPGFDGVIDATSTRGTIAIDDPAGRARIPAQGEHRVRVEAGAATVQSEIHTSSGTVTIRLRGATPAKDAPPAR